MDEYERCAERGLGLDYVLGRVMKCDLSGDTADTWGYDRDNGEGKFTEVVKELRKTYPPV